MSKKINARILLVGLLVIMSTIDARRHTVRKVVRTNSQQAVQRQQHPMVTHEAVQQQFLQLQKKMGIETAPEIVNRIRPVTGRQGTQQQFNAVRSELNDLLAKEILDDQTVQTIGRKIKELEALNPARWPQAADYSELLRLRQ